MHILQEDTLLYETTTLLLMLPVKWVERHFLRFKSKLTSSYTCLYGPVGGVNKLTR